MKGLEKLFSTHENSIVIDSRLQKIQSCTKNPVAYK